MSNDATDEPYGRTLLDEARAARSAILATALGDTIAELRLIDAGHLITYIRAGQWANISDLVRSSAELSFPDGTVSFACSGDYEMTWSHGPSIALEMEFQTSEVTAFFTLSLERNVSRVRVNDVYFSAWPPDERTATMMLARAVDGALQEGRR